MEYILESHEEIFTAIEFDSLPENEILIKSMGKTKVAWDEKLGIWFRYFQPKERLNEHEYYLTNFGVTWKSIKNGHNQVVQFNCSIKEINRRITGCFVKDENSKIYLAHRGKLGNKRGSVLNDQRLSTYLEEVNDGNKNNEVFLIGKLFEENNIIKLLIL